MTLGIRAGVCAGVCAGLCVNCPPRSPEFEHESAPSAGGKTLYERCLPHGRARQRSSTWTLTCFLLVTAPVFASSSAAAPLPQPIAAELAYPDLRRAQERLLRLYRAGFLERTTLPRRTAGRADLAYRLSQLGHQRLGTRRAPSPASYLRHTIDTVDAVCALNRTSDREHPPVQLWLTDTMTRTSSAGSSDPTASPSSRQRPGPRYLRSRSTKAPSTGEPSAPSLRPIDARWRSARTGICWSWFRGRSAPTGWCGWPRRSISALDHGSSRMPISRATRWTACSGLSIRDCRPDRYGRCSNRLGGCCPPPVGSRAWLELLAAGGGETEDGALAP